MTAGPFGEFEGYHVIAVPFDNIFSRMSEARTTMAMDIGEGVEQDGIMVSYPLEELALPFFRQTGMSPVGISLYDAQSDRTMTGMFDVKDIRAFAQQLLDTADDVDAMMREATGGGADASPEGPAGRQTGG